MRKGMQIIYKAVSNAEAFMQHGARSTTRNVNLVYVEAMQIETIMKNMIIPKRDFPAWCDAQDRVFQAIIRLGYGVHEVRTGK